MKREFEGMKEDRREKERDREETGSEGDKRKRGRGRDREIDQFNYHRQRDGWNRMEWMEWMERMLISKTELSQF